MELKLPPIISSKRDLVKLLREVEQQIEERTQKRITEEKVGDLREVANPSRALKRLFELNQIEISDDSLVKVKDGLRHLKDSAPQVRISFASEPDVSITEDMVEWFRREISPNVLIQIGVQPMIAGGIIVRSPMKRYDFSLRQHLLASTGKLAEVMHNVR